MLDLGRMGSDGDPVPVRANIASDPSPRFSSLAICWTRAMPSAMKRPSGSVGCDRLGPILYFLSVQIDSGRMSAVGPEDTILKIEDCGLTISWRGIIPPGPAQPSGFAENRGNLMASPMEREVAAKLANPVEGDGALATVIEDVRKRNRHFRVKRIRILIKGRLVGVARVPSPPGFKVRRQFVVLSGDEFGEKEVKVARRPRLLLSSSSESSPSPPTGLVLSSSGESIPSPSTRLVHVARNGGFRGKRLVHVARNRRLRAKRTVHVARNAGFRVKRLRIVIMDRLVGVVRIPSPLPFKIRRQFVVLSGDRIW